MIYFQLFNAFFDSFPIIFEGINPDSDCGAQKPAISNLAINVFSG